MAEEEIQVTGHYQEIFPTVLGFYELPKIDNVALTSHINNLRSSNAGVYDDLNIFQSNGFLHLDNKLLNLNKHVSKCVEDYLNKHRYAYSKKNLYISNCWANLSGNLACTHRSHIHRNTIISAVYFASVPQGAGKLYFPHSNLSAEMLRPETTELHPYNWLEYIVNPVEGLCVIFKSSTQHGVEQNKFLNENDTRLSIAYTFNIDHIGEGSHYAKS